MANGIVYSVISIILIRNIAKATVYKVYEPRSAYSAARKKERDARKWYHYANDRLEL